MNIRSKQNLLNLLQELTVQPKNGKHATSKVHCRLTFSLIKTIYKLYFCEIVHLISAYCSISHRFDALSFKYEMI